MNVDSLINYLLKFETLNRHQIDLIAASVEIKKYKTGEYFLKAGQISREVGFIVNGIFRICYYDNNGNEITRYFIDEINFIADINSFNLGVSTIEYIQAVIDCDVLILTKSAMDNLSQTIIVWDRIISKITNKAFAEKVARVSQMIPQDAKDRYENFLEIYPSMANRIPHHFIASYIGVTKSSLSRLRLNIAKKK